MKKKNIIVILLLLIPFLFVCGMSTWIILKEKGVILNYKPADVLNKYITDKEIVTYSGEEKTPTISSNLVNFGELKFEYKNYDASNDPFKPGKPINAGHYLVRISVKDLANAESITRLVDFTIEPLELELNKKIVEFNYDSTIRDWSNIKQNKIINSIDFKNGAKTYKLSTTDFDIIGMHDGTFAYGNPDYINDLKSVQKLDVNNNNITGITDYTNVVGSTYLATVKLTNSNYKIKNSSDNTSNFIVKYKTAMIGSTYYTIEDAISKSGDITFAGNSNSSTSFVYTAFSNLDLSIYSEFSLSSIYSFNYTINSGRSFLVPYKSGLTQTEKEESVNPSSTFVYAAVIIPSSNINLTFKDSNTQLVVGAVIAGYGKTGMRGVLLNNGNITFEPNTIVKSYGFIKGKGFINLKADSSALDMMVINDWTSALDGNDLKNANAFPTISWSMHNISCNTKVYAGAKYDAFTNIYGNTVKYNEVTVTVIGKNNSDSNCIFRPSLQSKASDFVLKYGTSNTNEYLTNITDNNQYDLNSSGKKIYTQRDKVEIHGNYEDGNLMVEITVLLVYKVGFTTSKDICATLPNFDLTIKSGFNLDIKNSSYVFLIGSTCTIEQNATLSLYNGTYIAFDAFDGKNAILSNYSISYAGRKSSAYMLNNGVVNGVSNEANSYDGYIGGLIKTSMSNAKLNCKYSVSKVIVKNGAAVAATTKAYSSKGNILVAAETISLEKFNSGQYLSNEDFWYSQIGNITFDSCGGSDINPISNIEFDINGYELQETELNTRKPERSYYKFVGWYYDIEYTKQVQAGDHIFTSMTLYAKWEAINYDIYYKSIYKGNDDITDYEFISNNESTYNVEKGLTLKNPSYYKLDSEGNIISELVFIGWYTDQECTTDNLIERIDKYIGNGVTLYALFYPAGTRVLTINFKNELEETPSKSLFTNELSTYRLINPGNEYNTDVSKQFYFVGWYTSPEYKETDIVDINSALNENLFTNDELTLYAKWEKKGQLYVEYNNLSYALEKFYYKGQTLILPNINDYFTPETGYRFDGWTNGKGCAIDNGNFISDYLESDDDQLGYKIFITPKLLKIIYMEIKCTAYYKGIFKNYKFEASITLISGLAAKNSIDLSPEFTDKISGSSSLFYILEGSQLSIEIPKIALGVAVGNPTLTPTDYIKTISTSSTNFKYEISYDGKTSPYKIEWSGQKK